MQFTVDRDFVRIGDKSFAVRQINSVEIRTATKLGSKSYRMWFTLAVLSALPLLAMAASGSEGLAGPAILTILFVALGIRSYSNRQAESTYTLSLVTSSGDNTALVTQDRAQIEQMRDAIEKAISERAVYV